MFRLLEYKGLF